MHLFTTANADTEAEERDHSLPAPEQWLIRRMNEMQLAEAIERHIDFVDQNWRSVHLRNSFRAALSASATRVPCRPWLRLRLCRWCWPTAAC